MCRAVAVYANVPILCYRVASLSARIVAAGVALADTPLYILDFGPRWLLPYWATLLLKELFSEWCLEKRPRGSMGSTGEGFTS